MDERNIEKLLSEEIAIQIQALSEFEPGSKEKSAAIDDLVQLYKLRIEENKSIWDADEKHNFNRNRYCWYGYNNCNGCSRNAKSP